MISVLLPYRDHVATLRDAAESVLADLDAVDELVAIDDGSSDGSRDVMRDLAASDRRVILVTTGAPPAGEAGGRGAGIVAALGRGLAAARGSLVGRMDADDVSLPGRFAAQRALLASDATLGAVGVLAEPFPPPEAGMKRYVAWQNTLVSKEDHARALFVESPLCHPSTMIRRSALESVGGWRDVPWAEDYDLWLRLDAAGWGLAKVPRAFFRWRIRDGSMTWTDPRCAPERLREARARFLAERLRARGGRFAIWGAGQTGKRLARALEAEGARAAFFVDIDPRKVGRTARGAPIVGAEDGIARARAREILLVVAVGQPGAREELTARLVASGLASGDAFIPAA